MRNRAKDNRQKTPRTGKSAGILLYRFQNETLEVFLVHPGGPFWAKKDRAAWSIPKGEIEEHEAPLQAARREFEEETGIRVENGLIDLGRLRQPGGKIVYAWARQGECDPGRINSNTFEMEWPPGSGRRQSFPEVDRAAWFPVHFAREKLHKGQLGFIDRLVERLGMHDAFLET